MKIKIGLTRYVDWGDKLMKDFKCYSVQCLLGEVGVSVGVLDCITLLSVLMDGMCNYCR
jgi:hypothetical protein